MQPSQSHYLKHHFNSEDTSEDIVEVVEYFIAIRVRFDGIFSRQGDRASTDHYHNKQVEVSQVDHKMTEASHSEMKQSFCVKTTFLP